jgi:hypothetical protein
MRKAKSTAGKSGVRQRSKSSRALPGRRQKSWRWVVDDRMRDYGDIDFERRVVRINRALHRREGELLIDTLFHEDLHRMFPRLGEWAICLLTRALLPTLSRRYKARLYARIRRR